MTAGELEEQKQELLKGNLLHSVNREAYDSDPYQRTEKKKVEEVPDGPPIVPELPTAS